MDSADFEAAGRLLDMLSAVDGGDGDLVSLISPGDFQARLGAVMLPMLIMLDELEEVTGQSRPEILWSVREQITRVNERMDDR